MKTANVADLRNNFQQVAAWISEGETVAIHKRGKLFATLVPSTASVQPAMPEIDFAGRLKEIWGNKVFSAKEVAAMRQAEREREAG